MLNSEKKVLEDMLNDYGNKDMLKALANVMSDLGHKQSDMGLKEKAKDSAKISDLLKDICLSVNDLP